MNSNRIFCMPIFRLAVSALLALLPQSMFSQTWQTVNAAASGTLVFSYAGSGGAMGRGLALTPNGTVLTAGRVTESVSLPTIFFSSNGGGTWSGPLDSYLEGGEYYGIVSDPAGNFYAVGSRESGNMGNVGHWFVRESTDGGMTWATVDDFVPGGFYAFPTGITADSTGNIYVSGYTSTASSSANIWTVRRGSGSTWTTVDSLPGNGWGIFAHPTAGVFAVGNAMVTVTSHKKTTTVQAWLVRRSLDGGATWATVDNFQGSSGYAQASGVGADSQGNIYVAGYAVNGGDYWTARKSSNGGGSWTTVDSLLGGRANAFGTNSSGDLFVAGIFYPSVGIGWQVRKNAGGSGNWTTIDEYQFGGTGSTTEPQVVISNGAGNVLVAGYGFGGTASASTWLIKMY